MAQQGKLSFPEPARTVKVDGARGEPRLWVRRLILWTRQGEIIREVLLRRGLNIIWSADPGAPAADLGKSGGSGHGAGKTLFCRLLRYCLGEETFANDELRNAICTAFSEGLVGAEIVIDGTTWGVVRPLGITRRIVVGEGQPENLLTQAVRGTSMRPLLETIYKRIFPEGIDEHMPGTREWKSWLLALAWLTRDQECRFSHLLEWRNPRADSRSPVSGHSKEQILVAVRILLDTMTAVEMRTRARLDDLAAKKLKLEQEVTYFRQTAERLGQSLASALQFEDSLLSTESLAITAFRTKADEGLESAKAQLGNGDDAELPQVRTKLEDVVRRLAVIRNEEERTQALASLQKEQVKALRGERANLDAEEIKARLGPVCPVCSVPIDQALAEGCGLSHVLPDIMKITSDQQLVRRQLGNCQLAITVYENQLGEHKANRERLEREEDKLRRQIAEAEKRSKATRAKHNKELFASAQLSEDVRRLGDAYAERDKARLEIGSLEHDETKLKEELHAHRQRHKETLDRLEELFSYVCQGLLDSEADARLSLTSQGIKADVPVGGTAMESLKAIAFDVAALLMSIEGRTCLPAFLVHDSPREADLGLSHYHKLFRFMAKLEALGKQPPFQYIITTTTEPPDELRRSPYLVAELNGKEEDQRLLRRAL